MTAVKMDERSHYFVDRLQELLDPRNEFESSEFFFVGGLLELTRQYSSMPPGVKELSEKGLRDSITSLLDKRGTLIEFRNQIPNKEIKEPLHRMFLVHQLKSEKYILDLYKSLMQSTTFLGILYAINHVVKRGLVDANEEKTYHFLDDLIYLLIEYLKQRGHTPQNLHRFIYTKRQQVESGELYENVYRYFVSLASQKQENMDTQECLIVIFCDPKLLPFMKNFTFRLMENYQV
ncbi:MAG: hypothetical protein ACXVP5_11920, partial [Tumebacillaceae bacterium]